MKKLFMPPLSMSTSWNVFIDFTNFFDNILSRWIRIIYFEILKI